MGFSGAAFACHDAGDVNVFACCLFNRVTPTQNYWIGGTRMAWEKLNPDDELLPASDSQTGF